MEDGCWERSGLNTNCAIDPSSSVSYAIVTAYKHWIEDNYRGSRPLLAVLRRGLLGGTARGIIGPGEPG